MSRIRIDLDQLGVALGDHDSEWVLDTQTGNILIASWLTDPEFREMQIEAGGEDFGDDPLEGDRFIFIEHIGSSRGFRWMEEFAEQREPRVRERLLDTLDRPRPFRRFKDALAGFPEVREAWHAFEDGQIKDCARAWLAEHGIDGDVFEAPPPPAP
jgi:hypothetical protein